MITTTGQTRMLNEAEIDYFTRLGQMPVGAPPGTIIAHGTVEEIEAIGARVRLGHDELQRRKSRRKQQRKSRRANR